MTTPVRASVQTGRPRKRGSPRPNLGRQPDLPDPHHVLPLGLTPRSRRPREAAHEIAERLKSLKTAHSIEPAPHRLAIPAPQRPRSRSGHAPAAASTRQRPPSRRPSPSSTAPPAIIEPALLCLDTAPPAPARPRPTYPDRTTRDKTGKASQINLF